MTFSWTAAFENVPLVEVNLLNYIYYLYFCSAIYTQNECKIMIYSSNKNVFIYLFTFIFTWIRFFGCYYDYAMQENFVQILH